MTKSFPVKAGLMVISYLAFYSTPNRHYAAAGPLHLAFSTSSNKRGSALPQDKILKSLTYYKLDKALSQNLIDLAESALRSWSCQPSVFLTQPEQKAVSEAFKDLVGLQVNFAGGYPGAENCRALFERQPDEESYGSDDTVQAAGNIYDVDEYMAAVEIVGNFLFEKATYDDFKSALINALGADKGQVIDHSSLILFLNEKLTAVVYAVRGHHYDWRPWRADYHPT
jgi:hypothetical protein